MSITLCWFLPYITIESAIGIYMSLFSWTSLPPPTPFSFPFISHFHFPLFFFLSPLSFFPSLFFLSLCWLQGGRATAVTLFQLTGSVDGASFVELRSANSHSSASRLSWPDSPQWNEGQQSMAFLEVPAPATQSSFQPSEVRWVFATAADWGALFRLSTKVTPALNLTLLPARWGWR